MAIEDDASCELCSNPEIFPYATLDMCIACRRLFCDECAALATSYAGNWCVECDPCDDDDDDDGPSVPPEPAPRENAYA